MQERWGKVQSPLFTTSSPMPTLPPSTHPPTAVLPLLGLLSYFCVNTFCWSVMSGWIMKFKLGPFDFQWLNICASNSKAAMQLKCIPECQSHSSGTPHCSGFLGEIFFFFSWWTFAKAFAQDADNLHHYSKPAYWWAQPDGTDAWATLSLFSGPQ